MKKLHRVDLGMLGLTLTLLVVGLGILYSASTVESYNTYGNTSHYVVHQILYGGLIGLFGMYVCSRIDYHIWKKLTPLILFVSLILLILVKVPGLGVTAGGASRWIGFGPFVFQTSEIAKLALVMYISGWIAERGHQIKNFYYGLLPAVIIVALFAFLILWQPDVGTMLVLVLVALVMFFVGGMNLKHLSGLVLTGIVGLYLLIKIEPYRAKRLTTFLNPNLDPQGIGYHINQALLAIGSGGLFGYGYGLSRQKHNYLPESIGDSIFAVMAEELGFLRVVLVLAIFLAFALRAMRIANRAPDLYGKMLVIGFASVISIQALINIGSITGLLPLTGIPLPFFSYGSSSLVIMLSSVGIILNVSRLAKN